MGFGDRPMEVVLLGAHLGRTIVINVDFTAYVCDSASTVGAAVWAGAHGGPHRARERGDFGDFCSPFSQWEMPLDRRR